jgi:hypothetical protein
MGAGGGGSKGGGNDMMTYIMMNQQREDTRAENQRALDFQNSILNETRAEKKAELDRIAKKDADRKASGEAGRGAYISNLTQRVGSGFIGEESAQKSLADYYTKYDLTPATNELTDITNAYQQFAPKRDTVQLKATYLRNVGRPITTDELAEKQAEMALGRTIGDIEQDIQSTQEYKKQRPSSAFEAEMEAKYGGPVLDPTGTRTGKYKYNFGVTDLPGLSADLVKQIGFTTPSFVGKEFIGSAAEIESAKQSKNNYETFYYNSGLTALKGNIDKEISKYAQDSETERTTRIVQGQANVEDIRQKGQRLISDFAQTKETERTNIVTQGQLGIEGIRTEGQKDIAQQTIKGDLRKNRQQKTYELLQSAVGAFNF